MEATSNYAKHTSWNPVQKILISNFYKTFFNFFKRCRAESVLDVGCGEGITLNKLTQMYPNLKAEGLDYSEEAIKIGKQVYPNLKLIKGDIYKLPYKDNSFEVVLCNEVLEHLEYPEKALDELKRVSSKYLLLSVPHEPFFKLAQLIRGKYLSSWGNHPEHIQHWSSRSFSEMLSRHGLKNLSKKHPFAWILVLAIKN